MKYINNVQDLIPDDDARSLRFNVENRENDILRDTLFLIDPENSPSQKLKMGHTTIYPTGTTTGHCHDDMEEVYFVVCGKGTMKVGDDEFPIKSGDALYVPPGEFHTTIQEGNLPLIVVWVTCQLTEKAGGK